jgi:vancomycin resistance protein VanW
MELDIEKERIFKIVKQKIKNDNFGRKALSIKYPILLPIILGIKRFVNNFKNSVNINISKKKSEVFFKCVIARHSSPLFRKLGESDPNLHIGKIKNLEKAIESLQGIIIPPNKTFSFWAIVGKTSKKRGYVDGMLLSNGKIIKGVGGGLCQLSNLLYWLFLHSPVCVIERKHHSVDVFPDSGRTIPFGAGATIFYNLVDLKIKNSFAYPIQIKLWITDTQLKGQILSTNLSSEKYKIKEGEHYFIKTCNGTYRYNEIWRSTLKQGKVICEEKIITNCAPVIYKTDQVDLDFS